MVYVWASKTELWKKSKWKVRKSLIVAQCCLSLHHWVIRWVGVNALLHCAAQDRMNWTMFNWIELNCYYFALVLLLLLLMLLLHVSLICTFLVCRGLSSTSLTRCYITSNALHNVQLLSTAAPVQLSGINLGWCYIATLQSMHCTIFNFLVQQLCNLVALIWDD